ncbi:MAG: hypothetical protein GF390_02080 [Candidatus Pacebacteria bacterium]|nr:hypothetical protein [Candidatus Paceibacterota bacterium]
MTIKKKFFQLGFLAILIGLGLLSTSYGLLKLYYSSQGVICPLATQPLPTPAYYLTVDVAGAVNQPGVYQLSFDSRVAQAIEQAQGFSDQADQVFVQQQLNLADRLEDGAKLYIPFASERELQLANQNQSSVLQAEANLWQTDQLSSLSQDNLSSTKSSANLISINQASATTLDTLPGIGEKRAAKIIENRPYSKIEELVSKEVLSEGVFADLKELISL